MPLGHSLADEHAPQPALCTRIIVNGSRAIRKQFRCERCLALWDNGKEVTILLFSLKLTLMGLSTRFAWWPDRYSREC
jgi:hypothetical protein